MFGLVFLYIYASIALLFCSGIWFWIGVAMSSFLATVLFMWVCNGVNLIYYMAGEREDD